MSLLIIGDYQRQEIRAGLDYSGLRGANFQQLLRAAGAESTPCIDLWPLTPKPGTEWALTIEPEKIRALLDEHRPNCVVPLGGLVQKLFLGSDKIKEYRGSSVWSDKYGVKVLPTFHPDTSIKDWSLRPFIVSDLRKAVKEAEFAEIRRPKRRIHLIEGVDCLKSVLPNLMAPGALLSVDVETKHEQITCIGLAWSAQDTVVVPLRAQDGAALIWTLDEEARLWQILKTVLENPATSKVFHNASYDLQYLMRHEVYVRGEIHDTMFMAHSTQPEWPKSLGFLGSLYCNESSWKLLRNRSKEEGKTDE